MKKILCLALSLLMVFSLCSLVGCGEKETLKLGFGVHSALDEVKNADGENDGTASAVTTIAAVLLDKDSKIVKCVIDTAENEIKFSDKGEAVAPTEMQTKTEKGDDYNMKANSKVAKEWYEQADEFDAKLVGKTADAIAKLADNTGKPADELVTAGCTINVNDMVKAAVKAATVK